MAEAAAQEEVLADVAERPFDLSFRLRPIRATSFGLEAEMPGEIEQTAIVDDQTVGILPEDGGLHAVVEDLARCAAERFECGGVAAQDCSEGSGANGAIRSA